MALIVGAALVTAWSPVWAHDELGFTGTVESVAADGKTFVLKYRENGKDETVELTFTPKTTITVDKKRVTKASLVAGTRVKVAAYGCIGEEVTVNSVQIVPATKP